MTIEASLIDGGKKDKVPQARYPLIGIVGPMGAGKSTLGGLLVTNLSVPGFGVTKFEEEYPENPFLAKFYEDPHSYSFQSQAFFLESKAKQLREVMPLLSQGSVIVDPAIEMDRIFAQTQNVMGWMSNDEFATYRGLYDALVAENQIVRPDFFVVVNAPHETLKERILERGRDFELRVLTEHPEYLEVLHRQVENFARGGISGGSVIYIDSQRYNFVDSPQGRWVAVGQVLDWMSYYHARSQDGRGANGDKLIMPSFI